MFRFASILDRKLLRDLWRIKGQATAIIFVIAAGISLLVMSRGMMLSLEETMRAYYERYRFADMYAPVKRAPDHLLDELRALPGVNDVKGRISSGGLVTLPDVSAPISARVISYDPETETPINGVYLAEGRVMPPTRTDEILLLQSFADAHGLKPGDTLPITMNGAQHEFAIAGLVLSPEFVYAVPASAAFRDEDHWAVFAVENGRARLRHIEIEHSNGVDMEVISGLEEGDAIVLYPGTRVSDGSRVKQRVVE